MKTVEMLRSRAIHDTSFGISKGVKRAELKQNRPERSKTIALRSGELAYYSPLPRPVGLLGFDEGERNLALKSERLTSTPLHHGRLLKVEKVGRYMMPHSACVITARV